MKFIPVSVDFWEKQVMLPCKVEFIPTSKTKGIETPDLIAMDKDHEVLCADLGIFNKKW